MALQPSSLVHEAITPLLDEISRDYAKLTGWGGMKGILLVDQDAKVIAKNTMFGPKKPWDMGGIGAVLHGVASRVANEYRSLGRMASLGAFQNL
jgi:hypothetical protein